MYVAKNWGKHQSRLGLVDLVRRFKNLLHTGAIRTHTQVNAASMNRRTRQGIVRGTSPAFRDPRGL